MHLEYHCDQSGIGVHGSPFLSNAFARMMSLRMTAVVATLAGLPGGDERLYLAFTSGLKRVATRAGV